MAIFTLVPMFPLYAMSGVKDTYYTGFIILLVLQLFDYVQKYKKESFPVTNCILLFITILFVSLFRNNGLYVILLTLPFAIFYSRKNLFKILIVFLAFLGTYFSYTKILLPALKIADGSIREVLSIPFQQTARYVKYHEEDLTSDQIKLLDKMLDYNTLAERYKPRISDPVKNEYKSYISKEELKTYFTDIWLDGLLKHPGTYIEATLNNVYGYFTPNDTNWYIYYKYDSRITQYGLVDYHYNNLGWLRHGLSGIGLAFPYIPLIGLIANIGFNTWILLISSVYLIIRKEKKYLIVLLPLLVSVLICIASPVNTYFRYTMPYVFMIPIIIPLILKLIKKDVK